MNDAGTFLLDLLGEIGGGRGAALNSLTPHVLGVVMWAALCVYEAANQRRGRHPGDVLILFALSVSLLAELCQLTIYALALSGPASVSAPMPGGWLINEELVMASRVILAGAFLYLLFPSPRLSHHYLVLALSLWLIAVLSRTILPFAAIPEELSVLQSGWQVPVSGFLTITVAIALLSRSSRRIGKPIIIGFSMLLLENILGLVLLAGNGPDSRVINPLRGNLALWAIPLFGYALLRVRQVSVKRQEHSIQNRERLEALGQLSSGIAHDFNNHLQVIMGYIELARSQVDRSDVALDRIEQAADAAGSLVNQLLAFSRGQKTEFTALDLNEVIMNVTPMISRLLGPDINLKHDLDINVKPVLADSRMIEQVVFNLVVNARDAMPTGGTILVETRAVSADQVRNLDQRSYAVSRLTIADTGTGMNKDTLRRAFEPFYTTKPVGEGTGLGLATVYEIVKKHGADIRLDSKPGAYTHVHIDFPVSTGRVAEHETRVTPVLRGSGETILLVEDETAIRDLAIALLKNAGYQVLTANDGQHAINIVTTYHGTIDLCLFDVIMPRLSGYQAYDRIRSAGNDIPVLFITGSTSRVENLRGQYPHLQKPFTGITLLAAVRKVLEVKEST